MKKILFLTVFLGAAFSSKAQVEDVSVIVTPRIGYNWFDSKSTIENGTMYGINAGFGFGKVVELRGIFERSLDLKQNFGKYESDIQELFPNFNFEDRSVKVQRIGGEFKTNIPIEGFAPFLVLGTGVQKFTRDDIAGNEYINENLYGSAGLGFKINLGDRLTFNVEGKGIVYNMDPGSLLYNPGGTSEFDDWIDNQDRHTMYNWSLMAGLQFYFGGRNEDKLTELDKAYLRRFSGGVSGTKVTLAPLGSYVKFNDNSAFRNTYMLGGVLGLDFSNFVGLQAYYAKATENEKISLDFDPLEMYGVDFVGKLNVPRGIVPYISIGGGYLKAGENYVGKSIMDDVGAVIGSRAAESGYYAKGGVGLIVPLSDYIQVFGSANQFYTKDDRSTDLTQLRNTDQLTGHSMFTAGVRLNIGARSNTDRATERAFNNRFDEERNEYDARIASLEEELKKAYEENDTEKALEIMESKKKVDSIRYTEEGSKGQKGLIRLTPQELEDLIEKVLDGVDKKNELTVEQRMERIEQLLLMGNQPRTLVVDPNASTTTTGTNSQVNDALIQEIRVLNQQLEEQRRRTEQLEQNQRNLTSAPQNQVVVPTQPNTVQNPYSTVQNTITPYIGLNFGTGSTINVGARKNYHFRNTSVMLTPEAYIAFGDGIGFGLSANGILPIPIKDDRFIPYAGIGLGIHKLGDDFSLLTNVIAGTSIRLSNGNRLTADYTIRGAFKNNQIAVGYQFAF